MMYPKKIFSIIILLICFTVTVGLNAQVKKSVYGVNKTMDNSSVIDYDVPANLKPGEEFVVTINMVNNGPNIWTMKDGYHLALFDQLDNHYMSDVWNVKNVALPYDVLPSQKVSFLFKIKAPYTAGMYNSNWAMTKDNEFFGEYNNSLINVGGDVVNTKTVTVIGDDNSEFVEQTIPATMMAGETYKILLLMKNTGKTVWLPASSGEYKLVYFSDAADKTAYPNWNPSPVYLSQSVEPGQTSNIEFFVTAPSTPGTYSMQWMMQRGNNYFGQTTNNQFITVTGNSTPVSDGTQSFNSGFIDQTVPNEMTANKEQKISITMTNTGTQTWIKGSEQLVLIDARMSPMSLNSWNVGYVQLDKDVPPGTLVTFEFDVKPTETGWQHFQWIMMNGNGKTFGVPTQSVQVIVSK
ncbi:MAG: NBR1-Ig-like domain-containing protein [Ignavibacteria bacterium]